MAPRELDPASRERLPGAERHALSDMAAIPGRPDERLRPPRHLLRPGEGRLSRRPTWRGASSVRGAGSC